MTRKEAIEVVKERLDYYEREKRLKAACEILIPELAESEDERIRKEMIYFLEEQRKAGGLNSPEWIAYLEKQKEQKPLSTKETELNSIAFLEQMGYTCIPPKKEHQNNSDAPKNALGGALNSPLDKDKNLDDIAQDYVEAVKEYNPELTWDLMQTAVCYGYHYREQEEQKPAEWSEEDDVMFKTAKKIIWESEASEGTANKVISWLKNRFKSLRPSWKPSEEQMDALHSKLPVIKGNGDKAQTILESLYNDLKKL